MLFKMFNMLATSLPETTVAIHEDGISKSDFSKLSAQGVDYLLGERTDVPIANVDHKELVEELYSDHLEEMRPMVDALRDWKYKKLEELLGTQWTESEEAKRLAKIISQEDDKIKHSDGYVEFMDNLRELRF